VILLQVISIPVPLQVVFIALSVSPSVLLGWWMFSTKRKDEAARKQRKEYRDDIKEIKDDVKELRKDHMEHLRDHAAG